MSKIVEVRNRNVGTTGYTIPDTGVRRTFTVGEVKHIDLEELKTLQYVPGGEYLLKNCLMIKDSDALAALDMEVEPEYFYTEEEIKKILLSGSIEQLEDTLNFAPDGVIELIKSLAVKLEIPDTRKRELITQKTDFNIDNAIHVNKVMNTDDTKKEEETVQRKSTPITTQEKERKVKITIKE